MPRRPSKTDPELKYLRRDPTTQIFASRQGEGLSHGRPRSRCPSTNMEPF